MVEQTQSNAAHKAAHEGGVKETLISLIISLAMALIVKCYIVEAYRIPTGSMAPTLLGDHATYIGPQTGHSWTVDRGRDPASTDTRPLLDPATGMTHALTGPRVNTLQPGATPSGRRSAQAGDRILVQKYLYEVSPPERFDVVVFRNPTNAQQNYIKRLVGLPNEHVWLVDGDIFTSPYQNTPNPADSALANGDWHCQRKSLRVQRSLWRTLFSSEYTPLDTTSNGSTWFTSPWSPQSSGWTLDGHQSYDYTGADATRLSWDTANWPITDWEPYNDRPTGSVKVFPVADLRMRCNIEPNSVNLIVTATITARQHEFQTVVGNGTATLQMRSLASGQGGPWTVLADTPMEALSAGHATAIEFWHADQALRLFINGAQVIHGEYDWDPAQRLEFATGMPFESLRATPAGSMDKFTLARNNTYAHSVPDVTWDFSSGPFTLHQVGLDRDIFYQPALRNEVSFGCHPDRVVTLGPDHFFMLGDNSADSLDGRGWEDHPGQTPYGLAVDPFVAQEIDPAPGVVHRKLMLGKAFFVYFPAPLSVELFGFKLPIPIPDLGHMRLID